MEHSSTLLSARLARGSSWETSEAERSMPRMAEGPASPPDQSFATLFGRFVQAAWRRRFLLIVPILVMIPISLAAALMLPRTYVARSLLVTQEGEASFLGRDAGQPVSPGQRVAGLEALLKSEHVLLPIVQAEHPGDDLTNARRKVAELRRELTIQLIGTDFLEVELKGSKQVGLGRKLHHILTRFFEVLLTENAPTATQIVLQNSLDELRNAERRHAAIEAKLKELLPDGLPKAVERLNALQAGSSQSTGTAASERPVEQEAAALSRLIEQYKTLQPEFEAARRQVSTLQEAYQSNLARAGNLPATSGINILNAPGRIKIIDSPADPLGATVSRLLYLAAGLLGAIFIGVGLAWLAELLDTTIRYPEQLAAATGVPVLATLPRLAPPITPAASISSNKPRRRPRLLHFVLLGVVIGALGYGIGAVMHLLPPEALATVKRVLTWTF